MEVVELEIRDKTGKRHKVNLSIPAYFTREETGGVSVRRVGREGDRIISSYVRLRTGTGENAPTGFRVVIENYALNDVAGLTSMLRELDGYTPTMAATFALAGAAVIACGRAFMSAAGDDDPSLAEERPDPSAMN